MIPRIQSESNQGSHVQTTQPRGFNYIRIGSLIAAECDMDMEAALQMRNMASEGKIGFLDLPPEIRNQIYSIYFHPSFSKDCNCRYGNYQGDAMRIIRQGGYFVKLEGHTCFPRNTDHETFMKWQRDTIDRLKRRASHESYRDLSKIWKEIGDKNCVMISPLGFLMSMQCLPLSLTCKNIFRETLGLSNCSKNRYYIVWASDAKVEEVLRSNVCKLLHESGLRFTEDNAEIRMVGTSKYNRDITLNEKEVQMPDYDKVLSWWRQKHWVDDSPLFVGKDITTLTPNFVHSDLHPMFSINHFYYYRKFIQMSRMLYKINALKWHFFTHGLNERLYATVRTTMYVYPLGSVGESELRKTRLKRVSDLILGVASDKFIPEPRLLEDLARDIAAGYQNAVIGLVGTLEFDRLLEIENQLVLNP